MEYCATGKAAKDAMQAVLRFPARSDADRATMAAFILDKVERGLIESRHIADIAAGLAA